MEGVILFLFILIMIAAIIYSIHHGQQVDAAWAEAAGLLGMTFQPGGLARSREIAGKIDGHRVVIDTFTRRHGKTSTTYTRFVVMHRQPLHLGLSIRQEGFFTGVAKAFGAQDIQTGDSSFDAHMLVKGHDPDAVVRFLTPERRNHIQRAMMKFDGLEISDIQATFEVRGAIDASQRIVGNVRRLIGLVQELGEPTAPIATAPAPRPAPPVIIATPEPEPIPEPEPEPVPTVSEIADALFAGNPGVTDLERSFAETFKGQFTEGVGILRDWQSTGHDFDFGSGPCVRAAVEVQLTTKDAYGRDHVEVILRLPVEATYTELGSEFPFAGRLFKVDGLMRRLFIRCDG